MQTAETSGNGTEEQRLHRLVQTVYSGYCGGFLRLHALHNSDGQLFIMENHASHRRGLCEEGQRYVSHYMVS